MPAFDQTIRGLISGIVAGVAMNIVNWTAYFILHGRIIRFVDWAAVLLTLGKPRSLAETMTFQVIQLIWDGFLGLLFSLTLRSIGSRYILIKSVLFGLVLWFFFKVVVDLYRIPILSGAHPFPGALTNALAAAVYGFVLGLCLICLNEPAANAAD